MKNKILFVITILLSSLTLKSQEIEDINFYKYVIVKPSPDNEHCNDELTLLIKNILTKSGIPIGNSKQD